MASGEELITRICEMAKLDSSFVTAAPSDVTQEDSSGASFIDETTDAGDAGANDVEVPDPFDTDDALYIGYTTTFTGLQVNVSTAGVGDAVAAETIWEYYNGTSWEELEGIEDLTEGFTVSDRSSITFGPPQDWATTTVDGGSSLYFVRFRATADDVYNDTQMKIRQIEIQAPSADRIRARSYLQEAADLAVEYAGLAIPAETSVSLTSGTDEYAFDASPFPTDMVRVISMRLSDNSSTNLPLVQKSLSDIDSLRTGTQANSTPLYYAAEWPRVVFYPTPGASTTVNLRYVSESVNIVDSQKPITVMPRSFLWQFLVEHGLYRAFQFKKDYSQAGWHKEQAGEGKKMLSKWRASSGGRQLSGSDPRRRRVRTDPSQDLGW